MSSEMINPVDYIIGIFKAIFPGTDKLFGSVEDLFGSSKA